MVVVVLVWLSVEVAVVVVVEVLESVEVAVVVEVLESVDVAVARKPKSVLFSQSLTSTEKLTGTSRS